MAQTPNQIQESAPVEKARSANRNWREQLATPFLIGTLAIALFVLVPVLNHVQKFYLDTVFITGYLVIGVVALLRFPYWLRMIVLLMAVYVLGVSELFAAGILGDGLFFLLAFIVLASMMLSPRAGMVATALNLLTIAILGTLSITGKISLLNPDAVNAGLDKWIGAEAVLLLFGAAIIFGFQQLGLRYSDTQQQMDLMLNELKQERGNMEKTVSERTRQLRHLNEISVAISPILDPDELLSEVVRLISNAFDCYFTAIFLLDSTGQWAELRQATGDAGHTLRENRFRIGATGNTVIAACLQNRRPIIALDVGENPVRFENPLLRYTRSQIALPLIVGERVLGVLDLQSSKGSAFASSDIDTFQTLADQVGIALENARLFFEARLNLSEMRSAQRQYLQGAWASFASEQELEYRLGDAENTEQTQEVNVPLFLRDQIIGEINLATDEAWTTEQMHLIESIATQAALALENARLVEESQSTATREKLVTEITAKIWSSTTTEAILQTAVRELGRALEASEVNIEISTGEANE